MAFEQILGRENFEIIVETREIHIEKHRKENAEGMRQGESLADNNNNNKVISDEKREGNRARSSNIAQDKEAEEATREREGGSTTGYQGKFEMKGDQEKGTGEEEEAKGLKGKSVESERSRLEKERGREEEEEARAEQVERSRLEAVNKYRAKAMQKRMDSIASAQQKAKQAASDDHEEKLGGGATAAAKENTERKKEKPERESSEAKSGVKERHKEHAQNMKGQEGKGSKVFTTYADVVKDGSARKEQEPYEEIAGSKGCDQGEKEQAEGGGGVVQQMEKKPLLDNNYPNEGGGREALGAVGETMAEIIGETMMKPAEKVIQKGEEEGKGGGVVGAIGETVAEIAQTTKVLLVGEGETESRQSTGSEAT